MIEAKTRTEEKTRQMPMYKVLLHNDNVTTMGFVILVLRAIFNKDKSTATKIMLEIHEKGIGLAGIYALEHAELKREQTISLARAQRFPLQVSIEPDS